MTTNRLTKGIELSANIAIIIVAVFLGVVLVKQQLLSSPQTRATTPQHPATVAGAKLPLAGVNWAENQRTLLLALSAKCHFCTESADFYKRLAEARAQRNDIRMVAVLPQETAEGQAYLDRLGIKVDEVRQSSLDAVGATGTPTLIMVDGDGVATEMWVGKLPPDKETEVLNRIRGERASG
jgi:thioredoxin-related protein